MKTLEFKATLDTDRNLKVPQELASQIPAEELVRVIVLVPDAPEARDWDRLSTEQFLSGYSESDSIYDAI